MSSGDLWYWLGWGVIGAINAALVYVAWWALFGDKAKGRRRCPRCWYDLAYAPGMMCSECGFVARHERELGRTHRRYTAATLSIAACVAIAAFVNDRVSQRGWSSLLPTKLMIVALPLLGDARNPLHRELVRRTNSDQLSQREWAMLLERSASGDWWHEGPSEGWAEKYGPFVLRRRRLVEFYDDVEWSPGIEQLLLELPARLEASTRESWPMETPFQVRFDLHEWWPGRWDCRITATPDVEGAAPLRILRRTTRQGWSAYTVPMPAMDRTRQTLGLDVTLERRPVGGGDWELIHADRVSLETRFEGTLADSMEPVANETVDLALRQTFGGGVVKWTDGPSPVRVNFFPQSTHCGDFKDVAVGAQIELLHDGQRARRLDIWWLGGSGLEERGLGWQASREDEEVLRAINDVDGRWQMRVTGLPELALRAGVATRYWAGQFTVPLRVQELSSTAPPVMWSLLDGDGEDAPDE